MSINQPDLHLIESPYEQQAFILARSYVLPSNVLYDRFNLQPLETQLFPFNSGSIEFLEHMLLYCAMCSNIHSPNLESILVSFARWVEESILYNLLLNVNKIYTRQRATFLRF